MHLGALNFQFIFTSLEAISDAMLEGIIYHDTTLYHRESTLHCHDWT